MMRIVTFADVLMWIRSRSAGDKGGKHTFDVEALIDVFLTPQESCCLTTAIMDI